MPGNAPSTIDELQRRVAAYRSGSHVRLLLTASLWLTGLVLASIFQDTVFGTDETLSARFLLGATVAACITVWPILLAKHYIRRRSQKFGLVCESCNEVLTQQPNWFHHIKEKRSCPNCGKALFRDGEAA